MPTPKQILWTALIAVAALALVNRTPARAYVDGTRKIAGIL